MQPLTGLQPFQALQQSTGTASPDALQQRFTVSAGPQGAGQTLSLTQPTTPPSSWSNFLGALRGSASPQAASGGEQSALLQFRSALDARYGASIAENVGRSLKESFLTVKAANQALVEADKLEAGNRTANADAFEAAMREARAGAKDAKSMPAGSQGSTFAYERLPTNLKTLLLQVTLGQDLTKGKAEPERIEIAASRAATILDKMAATPGLSPTRAAQLLHLAALSPNWSVSSQMAMDLLAAPAEKRLLLDDLPCPPKASVAGYLMPGFTGRAESSPEHWETQPPPSAQAGAPARKPSAGSMIASLHATHAQIAQRALAMMKDSEQVEQVSRGEGQAPFSVVKQCVTDSDRMALSLGGKPLDADPDTLATALRAGFPAGEGGDALTLMVSALVNQAPMGPLAGHTWNSNFHYRLDKGSEVRPLCADIAQRADGQWTVRLSAYHAIRDRMDNTAEDGFSPLRDPSAALLTIEFTVDAGKDGKSPTLAGIATDVVYNSAPTP